MEAHAASPNYTPNGGTESIAETRENICAGNTSYILKNSYR